MNRKMKKGRKMEERNEKKCKELMKRNEEVRHETSMFHAFAVSHFVCFTFPFFFWWRLRNARTLHGSDFAVRLVCVQS
jgi:uncharacterized membrane protein